MFDALLNPRRRTGGEQAFTGTTAVETSCLFLNDHPQRYCQRGNRNQIQGEGAADEGPRSRPVQSRQKEIDDVYFCVAGCEKSTLGAVEIAFSFSTVKFGLVL